MKEKEEYRLDEAIKSFYKSEPLKTDLAKMVSAKVFAKPNTVLVSSDRGLYVFVSVVIITGIMYSIHLLSQISIPILSLILFSIGCFVGLARKEYLLFSRKLMEVSGET